MEKLIYYVVGILTIISALAVISVRNPIHSVLYLILVYCNTTVLLIMWGIEFIGMMLLIVYVGAIAILFLFVVMMLNIKLIEITENQLKYLPIGGIMAILILSELILVIESSLIKVKTNNLTEYVNWETNYLNLNNIKVLGQVLYTEYSYMFILASIILLVGMIGAILLTRRQTESINLN